MGIESWMPVLADKMRTLNGISQVHTYENLPGTLSAFPALIILPTSGTPDYSAGGPCIFLYDVQLTLYVAGSVLPGAYSQAIPFIQRMRNKLAAHVTLDGMVSHCLPATPFFEGPGQLDYGDAKHIGIIFRVEVKEIETGITVSA